MLKILSFVCNEHTCLLSVEADYESAFAYHLDPGSVIWDFGLFIQKFSKFY
jgi:hypothetical protein